jgi:hypothetical protein
MAKRSAILLAAVVALVCAVPSMASASGKLTEGGSLVPVGATIVATGSNVTLNSSLLGALTCEKLTVKSKVTVNNGEEVQAAGTEEAPAQAGCKAGAKELRITFILTARFQWRFPFVKWSFRIKLDLGKGESEVQCTYTGTEVEGSYTSGSSSFSFSNATGIKSEPAACGTAKLSGTFSLETENGTSLVLD